MSTVTPVITLASPEIEPIFLSISFQNISIAVASLITERLKLYRKYLDVIEVHKSETPKSFYRTKDDIDKTMIWLSPYVEQYSTIQQPSILEPVETRMAWVQLQYQIEQINDTINAMKVHLNSLVPPQITPIPEDVLLIEDILLIIKKKHGKYTFLKNKIKDVRPSSMHYNFFQRLHFTNVEGKHLYVDYCADYSLSDYEGQEMVEDQIQDGHFEDETFIIKKKKQK